MPDPLLRTKLTVPPSRAGLVFRPRLIANLNAEFDKGIRLILISAPAGSGKSTLASEWAAHYRADAASPSEPPTIRFAWLSLDPADNQTQRFWLYLIGALQTVLPDLGQAEQRLLSFPQTPPVETILTSLLNQVGARSERVVLIVDDYHLIVEPSIHEGIAFILERMPANLQLVIATRADPPLPLSRLRVRNQLLEIRAADLSFTLPESEMLINDVMGLGLSAGDLAVLEERTEGWAAGVQLAAVLLKDERRNVDAAQNAGQIGERLTALVTRLSGRQHLIADYLLDEVLSRQPDEVQRFLLDSSILDELCASLCDALIGNGDGKTNAQAILEYLERANLFLIPLDDVASSAGAHTWFRYHHLFADALRIRLERTRPGAASSLHLRASQWFERNGQAEKAIQHALAAQDDDRAASLIEANVYTFTRQGRYAALLHWLEEIPVQVVLAHPRLGIYNSQALALSGKLSASEQQLRAVEAAYTVASESGPAPLTPELRGQIAAVRAIAAIFNADPVTAKEQAQRAIDLLPHGDSSLASVMLTYGNAAQMSGDIPLSIHWLREAVALSRQNNDLSMMLMALALMAVGLRMQGKLHQVETVCLDALDEVNSQLGAGDWPLPTLAMIYDRLGNIKLEWYDLAGAEQALTRALRIAENSSYLIAVVNAYGGLSALRSSQGNYTQAIELIEKGMQAIHRRESTLYLDICQALRAEYWVRAGNLGAARRWAEERNLSAVRAIDYTGEGELYTLARLWIAEGRAEEADAIAGRLVASTEASGQLGKTISYFVLQALARREAGRLDLAAQSLEQALLLGEPEGYLRTFLDEGDQLVDLLQRLTRQKSKTSAYARLLLSKLNTTSAQEQGHSSSIYPQTKLVEPLTDRELAVLRQMAVGSSNQEIAQRLVISVGTVKAHIYHITAKLGARSRTEAVVRARDAGLLP
jgi:LuxR family transcriptional regulator, maltose regulon positive regulatory protein